MIPNLLDTNFFNKNYELIKLNSFTYGIKT